MIRTRYDIEQFVMRGVNGNMTAHVKITPHLLWRLLARRTVHYRKSYTIDGDGALWVWADNRTDYQREYVPHTLNDQLSSLAYAERALTEDVAK